jgi:hypothetical protein
MPLDPTKDLSEDAKSALKLIFFQHVTDGSSLLKYLNKSDRDVAIKALRDLQQHNLIEVAGALTKEQLPFTRFAVLPSTRSYVEGMLKYMT